VIDLAVAVVIAAAFGKIVSALVDYIIMPLVGTILGGISFEHLTVSVGDALIEYGLFIQSIVDFFIISLSLFVFIQAFNWLKREEEIAEKVPVVDPKIELLMEIRDLLKK
jgi:large conductance mechanosensitive channel